MESTPSRLFPCHRHKYQPIDSKPVDVYILLSRHSLAKNKVHNFSWGHAITLLSEALHFTTYLSLYLHRIFKFYFFFFLTFIFSFNKCFSGKNIIWVISFTKALKFNKNFADISISEKIQNFDDFSGFCIPEFDSFLRDLAIFQLKCNEHSSIPKSQIKILATFP